MVRCISTAARITAAGAPTDNYVFVVTETVPGSA
jgi:hypothetical protein